MHDFQVRLNSTIVTEESISSSSSLSAYVNEERAQRRIPSSAMEEGINEVSGKYEKVDDVFIARPDSFSGNPESSNSNIKLSKEKLQSAVQNGDDSEDVYVLEDLSRCSLHHVSNGINVI